MGKNKGKKKKQSQSEQPPATPQGPQPSSSRETSQPPGEPKEGKRGGPSEQQGPSKAASGPQGHQQTKGKQGEQTHSPQQPPQGFPSGPIQQNSPPVQQQARGAPAQRGAGRGGGRGQQQQPQAVSGGPPGYQQQPGPTQGLPAGQQQPRGWGQPQPAPGSPPGYQQQPGPTQGPPAGQQQPRGPHAPQGWGQPQPAPGGPQGYQQQPGATQVHPAGQQQQQRGPPAQKGTGRGGPQGYQQQPGPTQGPPAGQQQPRGPHAPWGQPQPAPGGPQGYQQQPGPTQGPPAGQQQPRGPPAQKGTGRGPSQQQPQPATGGPSGYQQQPGPTQGPPAGQQQPRGPPAQQPRPAPGQQPSRSSQSSVPSTENVTSSLADLQIGRKDIVSKTNIRPGSKGRIIKVESNHLQLNLGSLKTAYHYDVNIEPDRPKKYMRPVVDSFIRNQFPNRWPAFDGKKNLYTSSPLTANLNDYFEDEVTITEEDGRGKKFKVEIKFANKVDLTPLQNLLQSPETPQEALQVVDIVLRMAPVINCFPVGRSFFVKPERIIDLGQGMEMYQGFYQSAIRGWKPLLNVDVAHKAFPKDINVVDALVDLFNTGRQEFRREDLRSLDYNQQDTFQNFIKGLRVNYQIPHHPESKRGYRVNGIGECAKTATFMHENRKITIIEYFNTCKNYRILYPMLPTLWVGNPQRPDKILLPMELCQICEGQALMRQMTDLQTRNMIKHAATNTETRKNKIMQGINRSQYNQHPCVKEFGFSVGNEFQKLDARVLNPPNLLYAHDKQVRVSRGVWRNASFLSGVTIKSWTIVNACRYAPRPDEYRKMVELFESSAKECGMTFASRVTEPFKSITGKQSYSDIEQYFKTSPKFDVIFVIVPESGKQYSYVKKAAEIVVGCLTQCIKSNTVGRKMNQQTAVNILLKVNSKLNGINHTFSNDTKPNILKKPCMIMGADVTHPGPGTTDIPSVAAVTASHDPKALFKYNICWRLQNPKVEIIEDLEAIVLEQLKFFYKQTGLKPETIVFFRDGVSEGQFEQVKNAEIRAIRSACKKVQAEGFEPKITFLVVQKRHHTRLFPLNSRDWEDRNGNVPAGTCVDRDITHPFMQDFYLVSHASIQGVAKPTKYCTLWDDNNMDNDQVEELAYYLCHMFSRCTRSVSYPAPTYYAHLAAARGKVYIENDRLNMSALQQEFNRFQIKDEIRKSLPMFFV